MNGIPSIPPAQITSISTSQELSKISEAEILRVIMTQQSVIEELQDLLIQLKDTISELEQRSIDLSNLVS